MSVSSCNHAGPTQRAQHAAVTFFIAPCCSLSILWRLSVAACSKAAKNKEHESELHSPRSKKNLAAAAEAAKIDEMEGGGENEDGDEGALGSEPVTKQPVHNTSDRVHLPTYPPPPPPPPPPPLPLAHINVLELA